MQPLPLPDGSYADEARPWTAQDVINWIPTQAESTGTRTPTKYMTPPGLRPFVQAGTGPVRGTYNAEGRLLAVMGKMLYRISNAGVAIPIGTVPGVSRVAFAHNQITSGNEVLVVNGSAGYVYNTVEDTYERITDEGYPGGISATFIDGYLLQIEPARRYAFHSDLADAMSYNTLDRFTSEYRPDLLVALASSNNELILFSETSYEVFENTGASQQPFRSRQITGDKGCASRYGVAVMDQRVLWLADDGMFYAMEGYSPKRISTRAIEQSILGLNWGQAFAEVWEEAGHSICYWTFPDGMTWGWDASTGKWHRRQSYEMKRWRVNTMTKWGQQWIAGDFQGPRLWTVDRDYVLEGDIEYVSEVTTGVIHNNQNRVVMPRLEIIMDAGQAETIPVPFPVQPVGPQISGAAPDGALGFEYAGYTYTVTPGDAPITSVTIISGALPAGLTFSDGVISATTPIAGGNFTITIRAVDENGLWAELVDTIHVSPVFFLLFSSAAEGVWISADIINNVWSDKYGFIPSTVNSVRNAEASQGNLIIDGIMATSDQVEHYLQAPMPPWDAHVPVVDAEQPQTATSVVSSILKDRGGVLVTWERNGNKTHYWTSSDGGANYVQRPCPNVWKCRGMDRMPSGRWIAYFSEGSSRDCFYTDEEVPTTWIPAGINFGFSSANCMGAGEYGYIVDNLNRVYRTANGVDWVQVFDLAGQGPTNQEVFVTSTGSVLIHGINASGIIMVSRNNGDLFAPVQFAATGDMLKVSEAGGYLLGSYDGPTFYFSQDDAAIWAERTPPFSGYLNAATVMAIDATPPEST